MRKDYSVIEATNWYSYANNNPVRYVDPTGMEAEDGLNLKSLGLEHPVWRFGPNTPINMPDRLPAYHPSKGPTFRKHTAPEALLCLVNRLLNLINGL